MKAPVCTIIGYDLDFYQHLPKLFPHTDAKSWFAGNDEKIFDTAFRNGTLQGAYLIMAARALGLDCGPMSGFDNAAVDRKFFAGTTSNRTSCAISLMATRACCSRASRASTSTRWRRSSKTLR
jgi:3-hydroxypropanoate dehydrogenase